MTLETMDGLRASIQNGADPVALIKKYGGVKEVLEVILRELLSGSLPRRMREYDPDKVEKMIENFYYGSKSGYGEKLLEWYIATEGEHAVQFAIRLNENIEPPRTLPWDSGKKRNVSRIIFRWLRKQDASWYWSVPEFRTYLLWHFSFTKEEDGTIQLPSVCPGFNLENAFSAIQRAVREVQAQRDYSVLSAIENLRDALVGGKRHLPVPLYPRESVFAEPEEIRAALPYSEFIWFLNDAIETLLRWRKEDSDVSFEVSGSMDAVFKTPDPEDKGALKQGEVFTLKLQVHLHAMCNSKAWKRVTSTMAPSLVLEGVQFEDDKHDYGINGITWSDFANNGHDGLKECSIALRLTSPVGRIRLSIVGVGNNDRQDKFFFVGDVEDSISASRRY